MTNHELLHHIELSGSPIIISHSICSYAFQCVARAVSIESALVPLISFTPIVKHFTPVRRCMVHFIALVCTDRLSRGIYAWRGFQLHVNKSYHETHLCDIQRRKEHRAIERALRPDYIIISPKVLQLNRTIPGKAAAVDRCLNPLGTMRMAITHLPSWTPKRTVESLPETHAHNCYIR